MATTARKAAISTLVAVAIVVVALALWKIKIIIALLLLAFVISAAMRPGIEWLARHHVPRSFGILLHYLTLFGLIALFLALVVPDAVTQTEAAIKAAPHATGIKHDILTYLQKYLKRLPSASSLIHPAINYTKTAFEVLIGIFFTFAVAAYWIFERERTVELFLSILPPGRRRIVRDTWWRIDLKLGAFVRGELLLIVFVGTVLSFAFWLDKMPYWLLLGSFAGLIEIVPVVGPLAAGVVAIGVGLTVSWQVALGAGIAVLVLRELEDYYVSPHVLGSAVGLSPLVVLVSVTVVGLLLGAFYVLLAIPIAVVLATLFDVILRNKNPAEEETPTVIMPSKGESKK
jgi:predicted PurR-regulated permease PerM